MRHRRMALLLLAWCATRLVGCSSGSADAGSYGGSYYGGQTGSLTPPCGVAPLTDDGAAVASGNNVAIVYTDGCSTDPNSLTITGPDGTPVSYSLVPLGEPGVYMVRANDVLSPGSYTISLPSASSASTQVAVTDAAPFPTTLGTITAEGVGSCSQAIFTLVLDPSAIPYAPLVSLEAQVDDGPNFTWVPYGALALDGGQSVLEFRCTGGCNLDGTHTLTVTPTIAGHGALASLSVPFTASCSSSDIPASSCAASQHRPASWSAALVAALFAAARFRRRRDSG